MGPIVHLLVLALVLAHGALARPAAARTTDAFGARLSAALEASPGDAVRPFAQATPPNARGGAPTPITSASGEPGTRILVAFRADASDVARADAVRSIGGRIEAELASLGVTRIVVPSDAADASGDGPAIAAAVARHPAVELAEHDSTVRIAFDPNDPLYRAASDPITGLGQWGIRTAKVDQAWDRVRASSAIIVAIIDSGVDATHPDLQGVLLPGGTFVTRGSSECAEGETRDDNSHGTHIAGIIGASANNSQGVAGVAFGVRVLPVKALDCTGAGALSDVANGITFAADRGARIINLSLGSVADSFTMRRAIESAVARNVLIVAAAGNCGRSGNGCTSLNEVNYPAAYPEVIAVGATSTDDTVSFFSTQNETVDIAAPGDRIVSTTPTYPTFRSRSSTNPARLNYEAFRGTSQSAPFIAGVAALIWSQDPGLSATGVRERLLAAVDDLGAAGRDNGYGAGRVNALRAVSSGEAGFGVTYDTTSMPRAAATGKPFSATVRLTNKSTFLWPKEGSGAVRLAWSWSDAAGQAVAGLTGTAAMPADVPIGATVSVIGTVTPPATAGTYTLKLDLTRDPSITFSSRGAGVAAVVVNVGSGFSASYTPVATGATFNAGATSTFAVSVTNTGTEIWPAAGERAVRLSYHWLAGAPTTTGPAAPAPLPVVIWDGLRGRLPSDIGPGASAKVDLPVIPPDKAGTYTLRLDLVQEGIAWFSGIGVTPHDIPARVTSAFAATYTVGTPVVLLPGGRSTISVAVKNAGTVPWVIGGANPVRLAAHITEPNGSVVSWDGARTSFSAEVAPGGSVETTVVVDAPVIAGIYRVRVDLVREGLSWFSALGVATGDAFLNVAADYRAALPSGPLTVSRAAPAVDVQVTNTGIATWTAGGRSPLALAPHWFDAAGKVLVWDGPRTPITSTVAPNASVTLRVALGTPPPGAAAVTIDVVSEGLRWFGAGTSRPVTLLP